MKTILLLFVFLIYFYQSQAVTCDLLSVSTPWSSLKHSGCAAHCLVKGFHDGHCDNGICRCYN